MAHKKTMLQNNAALSLPTPGDHYALVFQIPDLRSFQEKFGSTVSSLALDDLKEGFRQLLPGLLERYHVRSDIIIPVPGTWYVLFSQKKSDLPLDISEQADVLSREGTQRARTMLHECFGLSTGEWMDFNLAVLPVPSHLPQSALHSYMNDELLKRPAVRRQHAAVSRDDLNSIIDKADFDIYLHPIISLSDNSIAGYEALARGPRHSPVFRAPDLFATASYYGFQDRLELACITKVLDRSRDLMEPYWITINVSPDVFVRPSFLDIIDQLHPDTIRNRTIFEITEHSPIQASERLLNRAQDMKARGIALALDDTGCGFAHLDSIKNIPFKIVKLCITVTNRIGRHPDVIKDITRTVREISTMGGVVLSEGVERIEQVEMLKKTGVSLVQGFYYGEPRHIDKVLQI